MFRHFHIPQVNKLTGFLAEGAKPHEMVRILVRERIPADDPHFYMFINQMENELLQKVRVSGDQITNFFAVIHADDSADIYIDYTVKVEAKINRDIEAFGNVYVKDITDIRRFKPDGITLLPNDAVVCCMKLGWKYGLFFDFTRELEEEDIWLELGKLYNQLHFERIIENISYKIREQEKPHLITEGKTDWRHIEAARRVLEPDMLIGYPGSDNALGDDGLLRTCEALSQLGPPNPTKIIAIFDRDNPGIMRKLAEKGDINSYQSWGNNVYSMVLPLPEKRKLYKNVCIEMLYTEKDLRTKDGQGRRLFFDNELRKEIPPNGNIKHIPMKRDAAKEFDKKVFDGKAEDIVDRANKKRGLSKALFAELIYNQDPAFTGLDFSNFSPLFETIKETLKQEPPLP